MIGTCGGGGGAGTVDDTMSDWQLALSRGCSGTVCANVHRANVALSNARSIRRFYRQQTEKLRGESSILHRAMESRVAAMAEKVVVGAIAGAIIIVGTYAVMAGADLSSYWVEFAFLVAAVVGIGALIAVAQTPRPFVKAAILSFSTIVCLQCVSYLKMTASPTYLRPAVLPPAAIMILSAVALSAMFGGITGVVAVAIWSIRVRRG